MSRTKNPILDKGINLTRRRFVQGVAMGGLFAGMGLGSRSLMAAAFEQFHPGSRRHSGGGFT